MIKFLSFILLCCLIASTSCNQSQSDLNEKSNAMQDPYEPKEYVELKHPEWSKNASIYEVNIRQYTPEGTFKAFEAHLPRLKKLVLIFYG